MGEADKQMFALFLSCTHCVCRFFTLGDAAGLLCRAHFNDH